MTTITDPTIDHRAVRSLTATWIGGPTLRLTYAGLTFLTDPTFDDPGEYAGAVTLRKLIGPALRPDQVGPVDAVLLSHDQHADNLDTGGRRFLREVPVVLSTPATAERLAAEHEAAEHVDGGRVDGVRGLAPWEAVTLGAPGGEVRVTAVPARHGPEGCEPLSGPVTGFVLEADGAPRVYVSGDNASLDVVEQVARRFSVDVAVLFVGGANVGRFGDEPVTLDARRARAAADLLDGALIGPVHHTDWAHFVEPVEAVAERFAAAGRSERLVVLQRGRSATLGG
jgi:L-ascorbate metabolism protein UlaG (beta-lactamase superfamily)